MVKKFNNKKGFVAIYAIIMLSIFIPFALFVTIDMPYMMTMNRKIKNTLDNASATAITCINEEMASKGIIHINESKAEEIAKKVIQESFGLNDDLSINEYSLISGTPNITIKVINNPELESTYKTSNGTFYISNPSVILYAEIPIQPKFMIFTKPNIKYTAISQAQFK